MPQAGLFGLSNSNKDFAQAKSWGKNTFNNAFPTALMCYFDHLNLEPNYLILGDDGTVIHDEISVTQVFNFAPTDDDIFYAFETDFAPFRTLTVASPPRADLVIWDQLEETCRAALEIKLTALPDHTTAHAADNKYGTEIVVRPDTIVAMALKIAYLFKDDSAPLAQSLAELSAIKDWTNADEMLALLPIISDVLDTFLLNHLHLQSPLVLQPIWKTYGKTLMLHEQAFDIFIWSDFAFTRLFFRDRMARNRITRGARSIIWLAKMLFDFATYGKIDYHRVIDTLSFNTKNDKAFAVSGTVTQPFMASRHLETPRLSKYVLKDIILNNGHHYLSPERRLDAAILSTPELFE